MLIEKDYTDKHGIPRRVLVEGETSAPDKGILVSIYIDDVLKEKGCSPEFRKRLIIEMHKRGLITPEDVRNPKSAELLRAALLATVQIDVQTLQAIAEEQFTNVRNHHR